MRIMFPGIHTQNLEVSYKFYTEILGFSEYRRFSPVPGIHIVFLQDDESRILELIENQNSLPHQGTSSGSKVTIVLGIVDMDRTLADLKEKGITPTRGPFETPLGEKYAFIEDPDGIEIEFGTIIL